MIPKTILLLAGIVFVIVVGERLHRWNWKRHATANGCHCGEVAR